MGWTTEESGFDSLPHNFLTGSGAQPTSCTIGTGEANHSPSSNVEVKNGGAILPLSHTSSWRGV
jgi:hypothetical protein